MPKHIYDPNFKYVPAAKTDIRVTFARVRAEMEAKQAASRWLDAVEIKAIAAVLRGK